MGSSRVRMDIKYPTSELDQQWKVGGGFVLSFRFRTDVCIIY